MSSGGADLSLEGQEALLALMLEPHGDLVDPLADCMTADETAAFRIGGAMSVAELSAIVADRYDCSLKMDFEHKENAARFWYISEEKLEPRLGNRFTEEGVELEQPLCTARLARELHDALARWPALPQSQSRYSVCRQVRALLCACEISPEVILLAATARLNFAIYSP